MANVSNANQMATGSAVSDNPSHISNGDHNTNYTNENYQFNLGTNYTQFDDPIYKRRIENYKTQKSNSDDKKQHMI